MKELSRTYRDEKGAMTERIANKRHINMRPRDEWDRIEEARQDPQEAKAKMASHMNKMALAYREQKTQMEERLKMNPKMSFRSAERNEVLEEARRDPKEAL